VLGRRHSYELSAACSTAAEHSVIGQQASITLYTTEHDSRDSEATAAGQANRSLAQSIQSPELLTMNREVCRSHGVILLWWRSHHVSVPKDGLEWPLLLRLLNGCPHSCLVAAVRQPQGVPEATASQVSVLIIHCHPVPDKWDAAQHGSMSTACHHTARSMITWVSKHKKTHSVQYTALI
jgi:hypothetical protein